MLSQVAPLPAPGATGPFKVVLINPYELGRQPFALAEPAAWLKREGFAVTCLDLSLQKLDPEILEDADLAALYVGMHTATDRKSTRLNSSHVRISYAVFCLKKKK